MHNRKPNIVLIMSDQHQAAIMGNAGDPLVQTPNLDRLAETGTRFTDAHTSCPLCVPARMGFMTGRYPSEIDNWTNGCILPTYVPTFAHGLGAAGYEATLCGKMHFIGYDQFHGFEKRLAPDCYGKQLFPEVVYRGPYGNWTGGGKYPVEMAGYGYQGFQYYDDTVTDRAVEYLSNRRADERPLCLVVGLICPHNPYVCRKELFDYYHERVSLPESFVLEERAPFAYLETLRRAYRLNELTVEQHRRARAAYYGLVTEMDEKVGRVMDAVAASECADNTAVIYCSDHGDMAGDYGLWYKSNFMNGSVKVPLIASWPGHWREGVESKAVTSLVDIAPTLLDACGAPSLPAASGRSVVGLLDGSCSEAQWENLTFAEEAGAVGSGPKIMVRRDEWKFAYYAADDSCELFNENEDPAETCNRAKDPACFDLVRDFRALINERWSATSIEQTLEKARQEKAFINACGHPEIPHAQVPLIAPDDSHQFDMEQLPVLPERFQETS